MRFIEVTNDKGTKTLINVSNITAITETGDGQAAIGLTNGLAAMVEEPYADIRKILDTIAIEEAGL